jgi:hypothetical protein
MWGNGHLPPVLPFGFSMKISDSEVIERAKISFQNSVRCAEWSQLTPSVKKIKPRSHHGEQTVNIRSLLDVSAVFRPAHFQFAPGRPLHALIPARCFLA